MVQIVVSLVNLPHVPTKRADAELILDGDLAGFRLTGFQVWVSIDAPDVMAVSFPGRHFQKGKSGFYNYLRPTAVDGDMGVADRLKAAIITAYHAAASKKQPPRVVLPRPQLVARADDPRGLRSPRSSAEFGTALAASAALPPASAVPTPEPEPAPEPAAHTAAEIALAQAKDDSIIENDRERAALHATIAEMTARVAALDPGPSQHAPRPATRRTRPATGRKRKAQRKGKPARRTAATGRQKAQKRRPKPTRRQARKGGAR